MNRILLVPVLFVMTVVGSHGEGLSADEERAIKQTLATFYEGWNTHDPAMMVSAFTEDVDHINVFGEWHKGKAEIRKDIEFMHGPNGPARTSHKKWVAEKIRMMTPQVAVVQVRSTNALGANLGTYVMEKQEGRWLIVSFTNVIPQTPPYKK